MGDTSQATLQPTTAHPEKLEETLLSLCHQLQSLKGYSSIEGNRLVEATLAAAESAKLAPRAAKYMSVQGQLQQELDRLHELQCSTPRRREAEAAVLRALLRCLNQVAGAPLDELAVSPPATPTAASVAFAASCQGGRCQQTDNLVESDTDGDDDDDDDDDDDGDDPFHIPIPSAVAMADATNFYVLAQPVTAEASGSGLVIAIESDVKTPPLQDKIQTLRCSSSSSSSASPGPIAAECPTHDQPSTLADGVGGRSNAASSSSSESAPEPTTKAADVAAEEAAIKGASAAAITADGSGSEADEQLQRLRHFLHTDTRATVFREELRLTPEGCERVAHMLSSSSSRVTKLCVQNNLIGDEGVTALCVGLRTSAGLVMLDLSNNAITDKGADELVSALMAHPSLTQLQLCRNDLGDMAAVRLAELLRSSTKLSSLGLAHNRIGKAGCQALHAAISASSTLKQLQILPGNQVTEREAKALAKAVRRNNGFSLRALLDHL